MTMRKRYEIAKAAKVGDVCLCPSCEAEFVKTNYQQAFCRTKGGTVCKDKYWNIVTAGKRNNRTRIFPASAAWMARHKRMTDNEYYLNSIHPCSSEALGQD